MPAAAARRVVAALALLAATLLAIAVLAAGCSGGSTPTSTQGAALARGPGPAGTATATLPPSTTGPSRTATSGRTPSANAGASVPTEPAPRADTAFTVALHTGGVGTLHAVAHPVTVPAGATVVTAPEPPGCPWTSQQQVTQHGATVPAGCDWSDTTVWVRNAAYPTAPATGITYVYGHACKFHICPFSSVQQTPAGGFTVRAGDTAVITTTTHVLTYRVCNVGSSPKSGPAVQPTCSGTVDLDVVTCDYDADGASTRNIIIAATLVSSAPRRG